MEIIGIELFPLAKILIQNQMRKLGFIIKNLIILDEPGKPAAGFYDDATKTIGLNIGSFGNFLSRYDLEDTPEEELPKRCGAAVLFEECYHAAHHKTKYNTEKLAIEYAKEQVNKLPTEIVLSNPISEEKLPKKTTVELISGGMVEYINKIKELGEINETVETQYSTMTICNNAHTTTIEHITNIDKLNKVKKSLGNIQKAGIEYAGMIYVFENNKWKSFIDLDHEKMIETDILKSVKITLTKKEEIIEALINN